MRLAPRNRTSAAFKALLVHALVACACLAPRAQSASEAGAAGAGAPAQREATPAATPAGSRVRGRVVYADSRRPLRRAEVTLFDALTGQQAVSAVADRRGEFAFEGVGAGRYYVVADAPDIVSYAHAGRRGKLLMMLALGEVEGGYAEVAVGDKGTVETEVRARRGGVITGRVTTEDGEPVADADVKLFLRDRGRLVRFEPTWHEFDRGSRGLKTDSRGVYRLAGLPAGEYVVRVSEGEVGAEQAGEAEAAYADGSLVVAYHPSASNLKDAAPVLVTEGAESGGVDVRMPERATYRLGGAVTVGREGAAGAFAEITVDRKDEGPVAHASFDADVRADAEGRWELAGVPDGEYVVRVGSSVRVGSGEGGGWVGAAPQRLEVRVAGADVLGLNVRLRLGAYVSGTISGEGGAKSPSGWHWVEVVPAAEEKARPAGGARASEFSAASHEGKFELRGLPAGRYYLRLPLEPSGDFYVKSVTHKGSDLMRSAFEVGEGASVEGVRVTLASDKATLSGRAVAADGKASPGAALLLIPADAVTRRFVAEPPLALADALGRFTLRCAPGDYFVVALARRPGAAGRPSSPLDEAFVKRHGVQLRRVTLKPGEQSKGLEVTLTKE